MVMTLLPRVISLVLVAAEAMTVAWIQANGRELFEEANRERQEEESKENEINE